MAVYSPGRRRAILLLVLTSLLLVTIDLRGNALLDAGRDGFDRAMRPLEDAADVVGRPIRNAWRGITRYDDLEARNQRLEAEVDSMRTNDIAARSLIEQWQRLLAIFNLESPGDFDRVVASVIGQSPNNLDQIIEINKGTNDGVRVGMPVVNPAGSLIGKVTQATSDRARVMLVTDPNYAVLVKIVRPEPLPAAPTTTTAAPAVPAGGPPDAGAGATSSTTAAAATSSLPPPPPTTLPDPQRETGQMTGQGVDQQPRVNLIDDSPAFGTPELGDTVLTAGGDRSLAPADLPVGVVSDVRRGSPSEGWILQVEPLAELDGLEFVQVILYTTEADSPETDG